MLGVQFKILNDYSPFRFKNNFDGVILFLLKNVMDFYINSIDTSLGLRTPLICFNTSPALTYSLLLWQTFWRFSGTWESDRYQSLFQR